MKFLPLLAWVCAAACAERTLPPAVAPAETSAPARAADPPSVPAPPSAAPPAPLAAEPCDDQLGSALVRVSCDGAHFVVAHPVELHPERPVPEEPSRGVLDALGDLLRERPEILFVRIEVYVGHDPGKDPEKRRIALGDAQRRADALLSYLWRKRGISAERLEAVAYEHDPGLASQTRWPVVLRIVQRAQR